MAMIKVNNLIENNFEFSLFTKNLFMFCNDLVPMRINFLYAEAATEKYSTTINVKKFCYALHWSCPGIVVETFENSS